MLRDKNIYGEIINYISNIDPDDHAAFVFILRKFDNSMSYEYRTLLLKYLTDNLGVTKQTIFKWVDKELPAKSMQIKVLKLFLSFIETHHLI